MPIRGEGGYVQSWWGGLRIRLPPTGYDSEGVIKSWYPQDGCPHTWPANAVCEQPLPLGTIVLSGEFFLPGQIRHPSESATRREVEKKKLQHINTKNNEKKERWGGQHRINSACSCFEWRALAFVRVSRRTRSTSELEGHGRSGTPISTALIHSDLSLTFKSLFFYLTNVKRSCSDLLLNSVHWEGKQARLGLI